MGGYQSECLLEKISDAVALEHSGRGAVFDILFNKTSLLSGGTASAEQEKTPESRSMPSGVLSSGRCWHTEACTV